MSKEDINLIFSKNLLYWLEKRNKTQADLYKRMNVSSATSSDWCNGKKMPRADKLTEIADWLMIELSDLLYEKEHKEISDFDKLLFRIKDDSEFCNLVSDLNSLNDEQYKRVLDYINLLKK